MILDLVSHFTRLSGIVGSELNGDLVLCFVGKFCKGSLKIIDSPSDLGFGIIVN